MASEEPPNKKVKSSSESEVQISSSVKDVLNNINICQAEIEKLNEKASEEILLIEQKYNKMRKPFFRQRNEHFKQLPKFWGSALSHHPHVGSIIQDEEKDCLNYITDCIAEEFDDIKLGYVITFHFDENPYFENTVLTKTMHLASSANARSESTPIEWKQGKNLVEKLKIQGKRRRRKPPSFFHWFLDNSDASSDEVAETIKEDLWPSALQYYLNPNEENGKPEVVELDMSEESYDEDELEEYGEEEVPDSDVVSLSEDDEADDREEPALVGDVDSVAEAELAGDLEYESAGSDENSVSELDSSQVGKADDTGDPGSVEKSEADKTPKAEDGKT